MDINRLHIWRKALKVERMHTVPHVTPYNNGFHSCNAALIAHELCELNGLNSASVIRYMLLHDLAEGYTGDMPANVKRDFPDLSKALSIAEKVWEGEYIPSMPDLHIQEKIIAKVADTAELGMYCLEELHLGNKNVLPVIANVIRYLQEYESSNLKGIKEFIDHLVIVKAGEV